jgi:hypothetical protein
MLEFFGSNPFLLNLFQDKENEEIFTNQIQDKQNNMYNSIHSSDPILDNLIQTYNNNSANHPQEKKPLKTIYSEEDSSIYTINEEDVILKMPKNFITSNKLNGDKKIEKPEVEDKEEIVYEKASKVIEIETEEKHLDTLGIQKSEESKSSLKMVDLPPSKSFAMNRRGEEFLKMPSLNILPEESNKNKNKYSKNLQTVEDKEQKTSLIKQQTTFDKGEAKIKKDDSEANVGSKKMASSADLNVETNFLMLVDYVNEDVSTWDKVSKSKFLEVYRRKVRKFG